MDCGQCKYFRLDKDSSYEGTCRLVPPVWGGDAGFVWPYVSAKSAYRHGPDGKVEIIDGDWC